jgi:diguanylate cyclase (GGDEF)-like protein/PAS domain S-box-containing protein
MRGVVRTDTARMSSWRFRPSLTASYGPVAAALAGCALGGFLITTDTGLGASILLVSMCFGLALAATAIRQVAHFRGLVTTSNDLVLVFGARGCRYASNSIAEAVGSSADELLGDGFLRFVHEDDLARLVHAIRFGVPREITLRIKDRSGEWRHLEVQVSDLRADPDVQGVLFNARDRTERFRLEAELSRQAFHDSLTGLANRTLFRDRLSQAVARCARAQQPLAVALINLDAFKQVNEALGHSASDELLRQVALRIADVVRPSDSLARLAGDEFAFLLEGADDAQVSQLAERILAALAKPMRVGGHELSIGASIGIAVHEGRPTDRDELIRNADVATYVAKRKGRGRYEIFRPAMSAEFGDLHFELELRKAIQQGQLRVHYQPEISLHGGEITGVEALARWQSPSRGVVSPAKFIPMAEATGLIHPLGEFVLGEACRQAASWRREGVLPDHFVTWVNVSGKQLSEGGLADLVRSKLDAAGLPPSSLGLEVTETAVVSGDGEQIRAELEELRARGVQIAIDDFGTGFSSLSQLREIPADLLKVDQSFVERVDQDTKDAAIFANLVILGHTVGVQAIAEGIETEGQLATVRELDCDLAQGYLFSRPLPAEQLPAVLAGMSTIRERLRASAPNQKRLESAAHT